MADNAQWTYYDGDVFPEICLMCNKRTRSFYELDLNNPAYELIVCSKCYENESFSWKTLISSMEIYYEAIINNMRNMTTKVVV